MDELFTAVAVADLVAQGIIDFDTALVDVLPSSKRPRARVGAALQCGRGEQNKKMCPCSYISEDDALEVATGDTEVIKENIIAVVFRSWKIAIAQGIFVRR